MTPFRIRTRLWVEPAKPSSLYSPTPGLGEGYSDVIRCVGSLRRRDVLSSDASRRICRALMTSATHFDADRKRNMQMNVFERVISGQFTLGHDLRAHGMRAWRKDGGTSELIPEEATGIWVNARAHAKKVGQDCARKDAPCAHNYLSGDYRAPSRTRTACARILL